MSLAGPRDAAAYHQLHNLVLNRFPRRALRWAVPVLFVTERLYVARLRPLLGLRPSEKHFAYSWIAGKLAPGRQRILDVGSGNSLFPCHLVRRGYDMVALDLFSRSTPARFPGLGFAVGDLRYAPFGNGAFDMVTAVSSIEHIDEHPEKACDELHRLLAEGGALLVTMPADDNSIRMKRLLMLRFRVLEEKYWLVRPGQTSWHEATEEEWSAPAPQDVAVVHLALSKERL
ncbi:MAG: class I SAM-dependent methyltransferase [Chloroflexi bacterium]|nr:class I SAM-dependent methyltransferase [Chloroflexota bacterium]